MNFSWIFSNSKNYKNITEEFCNTYYRLYDTDINSLSQYYTPTSIFTFLDEDIEGFDGLLSRIKQYNIYSFTHYDRQVNTQPVGNNYILVSVIGDISVNNSGYKNKYTESILIEVSNNSSIIVHNTIFRLLW